MPSHQSSTCFLSLLLFSCNQIVHSLPPTDVVNPAASQAVDNALRAMTSESADVDMKNTTPAVTTKSRYLASKYMMDMYSHHDSGKFQLDYGANVVRSVVPDFAATSQTHRAPDDTQVHFTFARPTASETVVGCVLHMSSGHRLRKHRDMHVRRQRHLYVTAVHPVFERIARMADQDDVDITDAVAYDCAPAVQRALRMATNGNAARMQLSVVLSRFARKVGGQRDLSAKKVHRRHAPFMLLYVRSDELMNMDVANKDQAETDEMEYEDFETTTRGSRSRRSIVDPKYFLYRIDGQPEDHTVTTTPTPPTAQPRREILNARAYLSQGPALFHDRKAMRSNRRKNKMLSMRAAANRTTDVHRGACTKHPLTIRFDEIGWKHTIIAPRELLADYCGGECEFPLKRASAPSNHALLQSLLHHVGETNVPAVCCAPSKMDSLTLLYYDARENIVLKTFPKMLVRACGCM